MERLQKVIANAGIASRRKAEEMITAGQVKVNGEVVTSLGTKVSPSDIIYVNNQRINNEKKVYYILNKPRQCISAVTDQFNRLTVVDILAEKGVKERVYPIGRLDYDTTGVLLLTNDGTFSNLLMHPKSKVPKTYIAKIKGLASFKTLEKLQTGIVIDGYKTAPAKFKILGVDKEKGVSDVKITITEGKNHQVKKMFMMLGYPVKKLRRDEYGIVKTGSLRPGDFRELTESEVTALKKIGEGKFNKKDMRFH